jgi:aminomethyltransferase
MCCRTWSGRTWTLYPDLETALADPSPAPDLKHTPLHGAHVALGARMVPFAGYEMPVQYPAGIIAEHNHTRGKAGLFDVSHMGQAFLGGADFATTASRNGSAGSCRHQVA